MQHKQKKKWLFGLERKLFLMIGSLGALLVIVLGVILSGVSGSDLYQSSLRLLDGQTRQTKDYFDNYMATLQSSVMTLSRQRSVMAVIEDTAKGYDAYLAYRDAYNLLKSIHDFDNNVQTYLFAVKNQYVMSSKSSDVTSDFARYRTDQAPWYMRLLQAEGNQQFIADFIPPVSGGQAEFAFVYTIRSLHDWSVQGFLVAAMPKQLLDTAQGQESYQVAVWEQDAAVVYCTQSLQQAVSATALVQLGKQLAVQPTVSYKIGEADFYLSTCVSAQTGWRFASFYSGASAQKSVQALQWTVAIVTTLCIFVLIFFAVMISRKTVEPINRLIRAMHQVEEEEFARPIAIAGSDEVGELIQTFNRLVVSVRNNQILRKRAEIDALQKQMDPHFLFNTLESIRVLSLTGDKRQVAAMVEKLADVFRYNSNRDGAPIATVAQEIQHMQNYIDIQRLRFGQRLQVSYNLPPEVLAGTTLKFILQPIVENAIRHCVENMAKECQIAVTARAEKGNIIFTITDNGPGIAPNRLAQIHKAIFAPQEPGQSLDMGIGLKNIQERLQLFYGKAYGITVESTQGVYTQIKVTIPQV